MKISLLVPTRNRPEQMTRLWQSALDTADTPEDLEIVFYIDDDDASSIAEYKSMKTDQVQAVIGERIILSQMWNGAYELATGEVFMHCGDDIIFRSENWDKIVRKAFKQFDDKILFVYGRDGIWDNEELGTHGFIHKNWVDTIGYFVPPYFDYGGNDGWLTEVATIIKRKRFVPEIYTEHMHFSVNKSKKDATYGGQPVRHKKRYGGKPGAAKLWADTAKERAEDARKLQEFINNFKERH